MRQWRTRLFATLGQLDAAETEVELCWAAGRSGAVRLVEVIGPLAEARLAAARGDTAPAVGALRRAADGGRPVAVVMFVPASLADLACMAAIAGDDSTAVAAVGEARTALGCAARRSPPPRCATPRVSWPGSGANSPTPSTWPAKPPCNGTTAATGWPPATASSSSACSPRPASGSPRRTPARRRRRGPAAAAVPGTRLHRQPRRRRPRRQPGPAHPRRGPLHPGMGTRPGTYPRRRGSLRRPQGRRPANDPPPAGPA